MISPLSVAMFPLIQGNPKTNEPRALMIEIEKPGPAQVGPKGAASHDGPAPSHLLITLALAAVMLLAVGLRAKDFLFPRSLWMDEAKLALNILDLDYRALLSPLPRDQAAPPAYLWLTKLSSQLFGPGERALRLPAFLASLLTLPVACAVARRILGLRGAFFTLLILAICPILIEYASEVKQYQFDILAAVAVLYAAVFFIQEKRRPVAAVGLAGAGCLTLLFSHGVVFVTAGAGLALLADALRHPRDPASRRLFMAGGCVFLAGLANHIVFLRPILANEVLVHLHASSFPAVVAGPSPPDQFGIAHHLLHAFRKLLGLEFPRLAAGVLLLGLISLARNRGGVYAGAILMPLVLLLGTVVADRYSFFPKYLLFALPLLAVGIAAGIEGLLRGPSRGLFFAGCFLGLLILGQTAWVRLSDPDFWPPRRKEEFRPVLEYIAENIGPAEPILLYGADTPFFYYTQWGALRGRFAQNEVLYNWDRLREYQEANPSFRMWMTVVHVPDRARESFEERLQSLREEGRQLDVVVASGAMAYRFEVNGPVNPGQSDSRNSPRNAYLQYLGVD